MRLAATIGFYVTLAFILTLLAVVQCNKDDHQFQIERLKLQVKQ